MILQNNNKADDIDLFVYFFEFDIDSEAHDNGFQLG